MERAYRVKAKIRKREFKNNVYVWEIKILSMVEVPMKEISPEIWKRETSFAERLLITPEIQESIRIIKNKNTDEGKLALKAEKEEKEPTQFMKTMVKSSKTFKFNKIDKQASRLSGVPDSAKSGYLNAANPPSNKEIDEGGHTNKSLKKIEFKEEPTKEAKPAKKTMLGGGGLKLFGKLMDKEPSPPPAKEKSPNAGAGGAKGMMKLGLLNKKSTKKTDGSDGQSNREIAVKEESKPVNLLQRLNMNTKQKDKAKDDMDKAIKGIRRILLPRKSARLLRERKKQSDCRGR